MLLIALAALTPGTGSAALHGRQVSSVRSDLPAAALAAVEAALATIPTSTPVDPAPTTSAKGGDAPRLSPSPPPPSHQALRSAPRAVPVVSPPGPASSPVVLAGTVTTLETYYAEFAPARCWDSAGVHYPKAGERYFVAIRGLPCGTAVTIRGPVGTVQAAVWDHGPNCDCPERGVDASNDIFLATVGPLGKGVGQVEWWVG